VFAPRRRVARDRLRVEALNRLLACRRNTAPVGGQAATDAVAIWDEFAANREGICHTGLLVVLGIRSDNCWSERNAKRNDRKCDVGLHNLSKMHLTRHSQLDAKQMKKPRGNSRQL
jgi:hypothetical protein